MKNFGDKLSMHEYMQIFQRRKWFFLIPLILVYLFFLASSFFLPKIYEAKAIILIEEKKVVNPLLKNLAFSSTVAARLDTLREEILSWPRLYQLVDRLGLKENVNTPLELERLITGIKKNIKLTMKSTDIVVVSYEGKDRRGTQNLVNTLCDILIERNLSMINQDTGSAINFIDQQLDIYKEKLNTSEASLREFKEIYGMNVMSTMQQDDEGFLPEEKTGYTAPLARISSELAELESELVMATIDCTDEHPRVQELTSRIASLKEKRREYVIKAAKGAGVDAEAYVSIAASLPRQQEELTRLSRDKIVSEKIYAMLLQKLESAKITENLDNSESRTKFRIIEPARLPILPIKPNKVKLSFLGLILGGMLGFGCTYVLEYTDSSFKTGDDLANLFDSKLLGATSKILCEEDLDKKVSVRKRKILALIIAIAVLVFFATLAVSYMAKFA